MVRARILCAIHCENRWVTMSRSMGSHGGAGRSPSPSDMCNSQPDVAAPLTHQPQAKRYDSSTANLSTTNSGTAVSGTIPDSRTNGQAPHTPDSGKKRGDSRKRADPSTKTYRFKHQKAPERIQLWHQATAIPALPHPNNSITVAGYLDLGFRLLGFTYNGLALKLIVPSITITAPHCQVSGSPG